MHNPEHVKQTEFSDADAVELTRRLGVIPFFRSKDPAVIAECAMILRELCPTKESAEAVITEATKADRWNGTNQLRRIAEAQRQPADLNSDPYETENYPEDIRQKLREAWSQRPAAREPLLQQALAEYWRRVEQRLATEPEKIREAVETELESYWSEYLQQPRLLTPAKAEAERKRCRLLIYAHRGDPPAPAEAPEPAELKKITPAELDTLTKGKIISDDTRRKSKNPGIQRSTRKIEHARPERERRQPGKISGSPRTDRRRDDTLC